MKTVSYRKGYEFPNGLKERLKEELNHRCQGCGKKFKKGQLKVHHQMVYAAEAGRRQLNPQAVKNPHNMLVLCETCHQKLHDRDEYRTEAQIAQAYEKLLHALALSDIHTQQRQALYRFLFDEESPEKDELSREHARRMLHNR